MRRFLIASSLMIFATAAQAGDARYSCEIKQILELTNAGEFEIHTGFYNSLGGEIGSIPLIARTWAVRGRRL